MQTNLYTRLYIIAAVKIKHGVVGYNTVLTGKYIYIHIYIYICLLGDPVFLGTYERLQKATVGFVMSVCFTAHMVLLGFHSRAFHEALYLMIRRKFAVQVN